MTSDIWELSDRAVDELAALMPVDATFVGVSGHDHRWNDYSPDGLAANVAYFRELRDRVNRLSPTTDKWADRARRVALMVADLEEARESDEDKLRAVRILACPLDQIREVFDVMDSRTVEGRDAIIQRLAGVPNALQQFRSTLQEGMQRGLYAARRQAVAVITQSRTNGGPDSALRALIPALEEAGASERQLAAARPLAAGAAEAYTAMGEWLENEYLPGAPADDGVGPDRYRRAARYFLGVDFDPRESYEWGWSEVERIRSEMEAIAATIQPGAARREIIELLNTDPARRAGRREFVDIMQQRQLIALDELAGSHFDIPEPVKQIQTHLAPPGGFIGAYYVSPSEDFSRPGTVWFAVGENETIPVWDNVSTAYHEGFPGHHLQTGVQMSSTEHTSRLQRMWVWYSGAGEGWALYAERLMRELGYFEKPEYEFGMLASEMLRACRVVIDIGMHLGLPIPENQRFHPGEAWTFETAVEMLTDYAGQLDDYARSEVTRYLGWPGQAPSYKLGERLILELRDEVRARHGADFDLKRFHADVLLAGAVSLGLLREFVLE